MSVGYNTKKLAWKRDNGHCFYCGCKLSWETKTVDHVIPRSKGGSSRAWNIVISCFPCNQNKGASDPTKEQLDTILRWKVAHEMKNSLEKAIAIAKLNGSPTEVEELFKLRDALWGVILAKSPKADPLPAAENFLIRFTSAA